MSTQAAEAGAETLVVAADTYISSALTEPNVAVLPPVDDGAGVTVAVGDAIRFAATAGSPIVVVTADRRRVGIVPGYGAAVVVAESGADQDEADFWRFEVLQAPLTAHNAAPDVAACWAVLVANGFVKAE